MAFNVLLLENLLKEHNFSQNVVSQDFMIDRVTFYSGYSGSNQFGQGL
jgi:hypothetical protein